MRESRRDGSVQDGALSEAAEAGRSRWTIGMKIGVMASLLLLLQAPSVIVAHLGLRSLEYEVEDMTRNDVPALQLVSELKVHELSLEMWLERALLGGPHQAEAAGKFKAGIQKVEADMAGLARLTQDAVAAAQAAGGVEAAEAEEEFGGLAASLGAIRAKHDEWAAKAKAVMNATPGTDEAAAAVVRLSPEQDSIQADLDDLAKQAREFAANGLEQSDEVARGTLTSLISIASAAAGIGLISSVMIMRRLVRSMRRLSTSASEIAASLARGAFEPRLVPVTSDDEIGRLAASLNAIVHGLQENIEKYRSAAVEKDAAEAATRVKSEFLANMSHEIRTPMTAILGYADLLQEEDQTPSDRKQCVQTIRRNGEHLLSVINDILDISKIEAGRMTLEKAPCSPCQIVAEVAALMRVRAAGKSIPLNVEYMFPVPETIVADGLRLRQILMNLVGNAIKFTEKGAVRIVVRAAASAKERSSLSFEVVDSGIGMSPEQIDQLFRPFSQVDTSVTRRFGGTGLGLTISRRLARMMDGDITIASAPGQGSSFTLTIQTGSLEGVRMINEPTEAFAEAATEAPAQPIALHGRVLLAEDGPDNQRLIAFLLRKAGVEVGIAENGRLAVEMVKAAAAADAPFDLILMDMQMPELDGYGATRELRSMGLACPIVALTAHAMSGDREKCLKAGCDDYMTKPVNKTKLLQLVKAYLQRDAGLIDRAIGVA